MLTTAQLRKIALALPEVSEAPHHGASSFRVRGKIVATLWSADQLNVFIPLDDVDAAVLLSKGACEELWWGKAVRRVKVDLRSATRTLVARLLRDAWRHKAPAALRKA